LLDFFTRGLSKMLPEWMQRLEETRDQWDARRGKVYQGADDIDVMAKEAGKTLVTITKLVRIGNSKGIILEPGWIRANKVEAGDNVIAKVEPINVRRLAKHL